MRSLLASACSAVLVLTCSLAHAGTTNDTSTATACAQKLSPSQHFTSVNLCAILYAQIKNESNMVLSYSVQHTHGYACESSSGIIQPNATSGYIGGYDPGYDYNGIDYTIKFVNVATNKPYAEVMVKQNLCYLSAGSIQYAVVNFVPGNSEPEVIRQTGCYLGCGGGDNGRAGSVIIVIPPGP